jgi:hypothetical protein
VDGVLAGSRVERGRGAGGAHELGDAGGDGVGIDGAAERQREPEHRAAGGVGEDLGEDPGGREQVREQRQHGVGAGAGGERGGQDHEDGVRAARPVDGEPARLERVADLVDPRAALGDQLGVRADVAQPGAEGDVERDGLERPEARPVLERLGGDAPDQRGIRAADERAVGREVLLRARDRERVSEREHGARGGEEIALPGEGGVGEEPRRVEHEARAVVVAERADGGEVIEAQGAAAQPVVGGLEVDERDAAGAQPRAQRVEIEVGGAGAGVERQGLDRRGAPGERAPGGPEQAVRQHDGPVEPERGDERELGGAALREERQVRAGAEEPRVLRGEIGRRRRGTDGGADGAGDLGDLDPLGDVAEQVDRDVAGADPQRVAAGALEQLRGRRRGRGRRREGHHSTTWISAGAGSRYRASTAG